MYAILIFRNREQIPGGFNVEIFYSMAKILDNAGTDILLVGFLLKRSQIYGIPYES